MDASMEDDASDEKFALSFLAGIDDLMDRLCYGLRGLDGATGNAAFARRELHGIFEEVSRDHHLDAEKRCFTDLVNGMRQQLDGLHKTYEGDNLTEEERSVAVDAVMQRVLEAESLIEVRGGLICASDVEEGASESSVLERLRHFIALEMIEVAGPYELIFCKAAS